MVTFDLAVPITKDIFPVKSMSFFNRLFQGAGKPASGIDAEYLEFKETFQLKPDVRFFDYLREERVTNLIDWFNPATEDAAPKAFMRMMNEATRRGMNIWDQTGITMNFENGIPSLHSQDCLSVLAQILGFTIVGYYRESEGGELLKLEFAP